MGLLTETMKRLRDEIESSRHARLALMGDLVRAGDERRTRVSALCAGFARDRADAHRAWFGPTLYERQTAERLRQRRLADEAKAKVQAEEQRRLAQEARAKVQAEEQRRLLEEARAKARVEEQLSAKAKAELQSHEPADQTVPAPAARMPFAPQLPAEKHFKGPKKH